MTQRAGSPVQRLQPDDLRALRLSLGLSQTELAERLGYNQRTILRWESGQAAPRKAVVDHLQSIAFQKSPSRSSEPAFRFIDLFAGIGGLRLAFEAVGGECVFTSEWDKYCQITYRANFGAEHPIAGDIRDIAPELIPAHDVLLAGFPCQPFSIAGVSKKNALGRAHGFACEAQGTLFYDVVRMLKYHRPRAFLLENVKNLKSHDGGRTYGVIKRVLEEELGYQVFDRIIDAKGVVPQHRERIFIVGFRDPAAFDWKGLELPAAEHGPKLGSVLHSQDRTEATDPRYTDGRGRVSGKYVLSDKLWHYLQGYAAKHKEKGNGFGYGLFGPGDVARTLSARYFKDGSEILIKRQRGNPRRLTPRECSRLMGFDRPGRPPFKIPVSDTRAYKQFGNAVVVPVVEAVAALMKPHITGEALGPEQLALPLKARIA